MMTTQNALQASLEEKNPKKGCKSKEINLPLTSWVPLPSPPSEFVLSLAFIVTPWEDSAPMYYLWHRRSPKGKNLMVVEFRALQNKVLNAGPYQHTELCSV